mgnify:CR=1 FL=1
MKQCNTCFNLLPLDKFEFRNDTSDYRLQCNKCRSNKQKQSSKQIRSQWKYKINSFGKDIVYKTHPKGQTRCCKCKKIKKVIEFSINTYRANGLNTCCKNCSKKSSKYNAEKNKRYWNRMINNYGNKIIYQMNFNKNKKCYNCKNIKHTSEFQLSLRSVDGLNSACKHCSNIILAKRYRSKYPEKQAEFKHKRRMRKSNCKINDLSSTDILILQRMFPKCLVTGDVNNLHLDHVIPISKGGNNTITNMQIVNSTNNCSKGNKFDKSKPKKYDFRNEIDLALLESYSFCKNLGEKENGTIK